jgi:NADPH:quinone reductase
MSDWKQDKKHSAASRSLGQILAEIDMHQRGFYLPGYSDDAHLALLGEATGSLSGSVLSGELKVDVGHRFPMSQVGLAHHAIEERRTVGKVVLEPWSV